MAQASRDGWKWMPEGQPRNCSICGAKLTMKRGGWFRTAGTPMSFCHECPVEWKAVTA